MIAKKYVLNCFLLLIPIFLWNLILVDKLPKSYSPEIFWKDIPVIVRYGENILRVLVFGLPLIMVLSFKTKVQKIGFLTYSIGVLIYFSSWLILIISPNSNWSQSLIGFTAPAFTTIIFFIGIGFIGNKAFFKFPKTTYVYIGTSLLFVVFHTIHAYLVFQNEYNLSIN